MSELVGLANFFYGVSKRQAVTDDERQRSGAKMVGVGGAVAAGGLVGGGLPIRPGPKTPGPKPADRAKNVAHRAVLEANNYRGGIYGGRINLHRYALKRTKDDSKYFREKGGRTSKQNLYRRGFSEGTIEPEEKVIRYLKRGRKVSNVALGVGAGTTAAGAYRMSNAERRRKQAIGKAEGDRAAGYAFGGGATAYGASLIGRRHFNNSKKRWMRVHDAENAAAQKITPRLTPEVRNRDVEANPKKYIRRLSRKKVEQVGRHRGAAAQAKYFANVFDQHVKYTNKMRNPALAATAAGAAGLAYNRRGKPGVPVSERRGKED